MNSSIPKGSIEIQSGLWATENIYTFNGTERKRYDLHAAPGFHFWEVLQPENYDIEGNLLPLADRVFTTFARTAFTSVEELNANFKSEPIS